MKASALSPGDCNISWSTPAKLLFFPVAYLGQHTPAGFTWLSLPVILRGYGLDLDAIGMVALLYSPGWTEPFQPFIHTQIPYGASMTSSPFHRLFEMNQGIFYTRLLHEAIRLNIFDHLTSKTSPDQMARTLNTHPQSTGYFLRGLATAGLVEQQDDDYWNTPLGRDFLVTTSPSHMGDYLTNHAQWNLPFFDRMAEILPNGPPRQQARADDETIWTRGQRPWSISSAPAPVRSWNGSSPGSRNSHPSGTCWIWAAARASTPWPSSKATPP